MRDKVEHAGGQPRCRGQRRAEQDEPDLRHRREGEDPPHFPLEDRLHGTDDHRRRRERRQYPAQKILAEFAFGKHTEDKPDDEIDRSLGRSRRKEHRHEARRTRIRAKEPAMEREHRRLDAQPGHDEGEPSLHRRIISQRRQPRRHVGQVERASRRVEKAHPKHIQCRADGAEDQIVERRRQRAPVPRLAHCHQSICTDGRDFEKHERVERIACQHQPEKSCEAHEIAGLEQRALLRPHLRLQRMPRIERTHQPDGSDQQRHRRAKRIDAQRYSHGRRKAAERIIDRALTRDFTSHRNRHPQREHCRQYGHHPRRSAAGAQRRSARADQGARDHKDRRLRRQGRRCDI